MSGNNTINKLMDRVISKIVKLGYASCDNFRYNTPIRLLIVHYNYTSRPVKSKYKAQLAAFHATLIANVEIDDKAKKVYEGAKLRIIHFHS